MDTSTLGYIFSHDRLQLLSKLLQSEPYIPVTYRRQIVIIFELSLEHEYLTIVEHHHHQDKLQELLEILRSTPGLDITPRKRQRIVKYLQQIITNTEDLNKQFIDELVRVRNAGERIVSLISNLKGVMEYHYDYPTMVNNYANRLELGVYQRNNHEFIQEVIKVLDQHNINHKIMDLHVIHCMIDDNPYIEIVVRTQRPCCTYG